MAHITAQSAVLAHSLIGEINGYRLKDVTLGVSTSESTSMQWLVRYSTRGHFGPCVPLKFGRSGKVWQRLLRALRYPTFRQRGLTV